MTIRVLLADDQDLVRSGLAMLIDAEPDLDVVGEARDGHDAISKVDELQPDIVLMDVRMPGLGGVEATRRITQDQVSRNPDRLIRVIMLTTFHDEDAVYAALRAGASGYLLKDTDANALITGIRAVAAGGAVLDPPVAWTLLSDFAARPDRNVPTPEAMQTLTDRERDVLILIAHGYSNSEIAADHLCLGEATVKTHVNRLFMKLGLRDRSQAVVAAYQTGLVKPGDEPPNHQARRRR
jgi:DNA-binding NarL/FixJ family response regulator